MRRRSKKKRPATRASVPPGKHPGTASDPSADGEACLLFGLSMLDHGGDWSWAEIPGNEIEHIRETCKHWESMRINDFYAGKGKLIPLTDCSGRVAKRLEEIKLDDFNALWELRLSGAARIWGVRKRDVFYPIWWDPHHDVFPSKLKHT
jgi:hypothetical protein